MPRCRCWASISAGSASWPTRLPRHAEEALADLVAGRFRLVDHMMLECEIRGRRVIRRELGLNETSVLAGPPFTMIEIDLLVDGEPATTYRADGLIVSTPVGLDRLQPLGRRPDRPQGSGCLRLHPAQSPYAHQPHGGRFRRPATTNSGCARPNAGSACVVDGRVIGSPRGRRSISVRRADRASRWSRSAGTATTARFAKNSPGAAACGPPSGLRARRAES